MAHSATTPTHRRRAVVSTLGLLAILIVGGAFRFYNVNWDKGTYHIHPDERYTTMVITRLEWPGSLGEYFDTSRSLLNPRNVDMVYFYGTLPLFLTKWVATQVDPIAARFAERQPGLAGLADTRPRLTDYDQIHLVGRVLSAIFDLGSVLLLFFFARRLGGWRVGLIASCLLALSVLNIQGSHYFSVDTFLTFFVLLTLWFTLDIAQGKGWAAFAGLGLSMGLTLACKVSVFLLVVVVALGAAIRVRRSLAAGQRPARSRLGALAGLSLAVVLAFSVFRVAQPYAWAGPNYTGWDSLPQEWSQKLSFLGRVPEPLRAVFVPNPRWIADIVEAGAQQTGEADMPWGRQWTERAPWLYPLENMVLWGMGVPWGIAAWLGAGVAAGLWVRARRRRTPSTGPSPAPGARWDLMAIPLAWVFLSLGWQGMQFVKSVRYFLPIYPCLAFFAAFLVVRVWDFARQRGGLRARLAAWALAAAVLLGTLAWAWAFIQIYREPVTRVQATRWIYAHVEPGAAIAHEHFDDPLPFNMFGRLAYQPAGLYEGVELTLYDEDTPEKLAKLLDDLDRADYVVLSSGRLLTSIPRLPMRYPVTTRYYELLLAGTLGFEKAAEFHSYPRLFGVEFNDDRAEEQFTVYDHPKVLIFRKTAAWDLERARAMLSDGVDWGAIPQWLNPRDVPKWKREQARLEREAQHQQARNGLMLTDLQRDEQERGGTWASLFRRDSLPNRAPTLSWLILIGLLGMAVLPLTLLVFRWLPDHGYILARPLGVLLLAWLSWILTNLTPLHYSRGTIGLAFGLIAAGSLATLAFPSQRRRLLELWRTSKRTFLAEEALFLAFFLLVWLIRWGNPDLWHAWRGGEKPMDFAYLNAVIKSTEFPPYDPWFAGGYLNYYYFGQVMVGTLIKLAGVVPAMAYNLVIPTWFAMTAMGAFSATYNLVRGRQSPLQRSVRPILFGIVGALFVAVLGNLAEIHLILLKLSEGVLENFQSTIPGLANLVRLVVGSFETLFGGKALPVGLQEWYWNATRAIPPGEAYGITEFPFFTFLFADLHAHLIAMPLAFLSLSAALAVVLRGSAGERAALDGGRWRGWPATLGLLLLWALTIGAMRATNAWDVPPHLLVALGALVIGQMAVAGRVTWRALASVAWQFGLVFLLSWSVLFRPFWSHYGSYYNSLAVWSGPRTPLWAYFVVHGLFLFAIVSWLVVCVFGGRRADPLWRKVRLTLRYRGRGGRLRKVAQLMRVRGLPVGRWLWVGVAALVLLELFFLIPGLIPFTRPQDQTIYGTGSAFRGLSVFAFGLPVALLGLSSLFRKGIASAERLWVYWALLALAMTMGVEVIVIQGDVERMNTVFKFYIQVWLFWGVAAAAALAWITPRLRAGFRGRTAWLSILGILLACAALYPPLAAAARVRDRFDPALGPGLDGWAYMQTARYSDPAGAEYDLRWDYEAIRWLLDNVVGTPVILEGHAPEYRWGARYSINTGLPTVLGWNWHQRQQRAAAGDHAVWARAEEVATLYNTPVVRIASNLLDKYGVRYIIVGPLEMVYYEPEGLAKFEAMVADGALQVVFRSVGVTIYEVHR